MIDLVTFEIGILRENLLRRSPSGERAYDRSHHNLQIPNTSLAAHDVGVECDILRRMLCFVVVRWVFRPYLGTARSMP